MKLDEIRSVFEFAERKMPFADVDRFGYFTQVQMRRRGQVGAVAASRRFAI
jgi:hypothetical protein